MLPSRKDHVGQQPNIELEMADLPRPRPKPQPAHGWVPGRPGELRPLVPIEGGKDTAESIPGAELLVIDGMGHDLHPDTWSRVVGAICDHAKKVLL